MKKNLVLIGMPGCGKSTIGVLLAKTLGADFLDTDLIIQKQQNLRLQQIINDKGLRFFLEAETDAVCSIHTQNTVIATGGSVICSPRSVSHLKENGIFIYLALPFKTIKTRIDNITTRGIACEPGETLLAIYKKRTPIYEAEADIIIDCTEKSAEQITAQIAEMFL